MNRRQLLALLPAALLLPPAFAATKRETLPEYLRRITPTDSTPTEEWEVWVFRFDGETRRPLHYSLEMLDGEVGEWVNNYFLLTEKGPVRIDPLSPQLLPFTPKVPVPSPLPPLVRMQ